MVERKFTLESANDLQRIGLRAQIVSFLMQQGISKGNAVNDSENMHKVHVAIESETDEKIEEIKNELVKHLNKLNKSDEQCYSQFPADIKASALKQLNNPHPITLMPLQELASSLMLEQTSKGVGAMLTLSNGMQSISSGMQSISSGMQSISSGMQALSKTVKDSFKDLTDELKPLKELPSILKKLDEKLK